MGKKGMICLDPACSLPDGKHISIQPGSIWECSLCGEKWIYREQWYPLDTKEDGDDEANEA